jgi:diguanylate cyclase (GGDEF)-like protein
MSLIRLLQALAALLVLATGLLLAHMTAASVDDLQRASRGLQAIDDLRLALAVAEMASRERGPTNGMLGDDRPAPPAHAQALAQARARADAAFDALGTVSDVTARRDESTSAARAALLHARAAVDRLTAAPKAARTSQQISDTIHEMVAVIPRLTPVVNRLANDAQTSYPPIGDEVQAARLSAELREYAGLLGSHFTAAITRHETLTPIEQREIEHTKGRIDELRFLVDIRIDGRSESSTVKAAWAEAQARYFRHALGLADGVVEASAAGIAYGLDPAQFAAAYVPDMNAILAVRDALLDQARARTATARSAARTTLVGVLVGELVLLAVLIGAITLVQRRLLTPLKIIARAVHSLARNQLEIELPPVRGNDELVAITGAVEALRKRKQQRLALERERDELIVQLRRQSNTDALTGLSNRRGFLEAAERELGQARRHGYGLVAILLDIDHFKRFNDELGHAVGDSVLIQIADVIRREKRDGDLAGRLGGEEFVLLLGHCDLAYGCVFAERLRRSIENIAALAPLVPGAAPIRTTASLGAAEFGAECRSLDALLKQADAAMYAAKAAGRNQVRPAVTAAQERRQDAASP